MLGIYLNGKVIRCIKWYSKRITDDGLQLICKASEDRVKFTLRLNAQSNGH